MARRHVMLLGAAAFGVAAVPWAEPMATIGLFQPFNERGWTPKPTPPPMPRGVMEQWVDGAYYMMPKNFGEIYKRQLPNTCGFDMGIATSSVTCDIGNGCVTNTIDYAIGCCTALDCALPTACNNLADGCDSSCQSNDYLAYCGASTAPYCYTRFFIQDPSTTFTAFDCAPYELVQTDYFSTFPPSASVSSSPFNSASSSSIPPLSSSISSFSAFSEAPSANVVTVYKTASASSGSSTVPGNGNRGSASDNTGGNASSNNNSGGGSKTPIGAIVGGVVGGVVLIVLLIVAIICFRRGSNKKKRESQGPPQGTGPTGPPFMQQQYPHAPQSPKPGFYPYATEQQGSPGPPYSQGPDSAYSPPMQQQSPYSGSPALPQHSPHSPQPPFYGGGYPQGYQTGDENNNLSVSAGGAPTMTSPLTSPASPNLSHMTSGIGTIGTLPPQEYNAAMGVQGHGLHEAVHEVPAAPFDREVNGKAIGETDGTPTRTMELGA